MNTKTRLLLAALACTPWLAMAEPAPAGSAPSISFPPPPAHMEASPGHQMHEMPMGMERGRQGPGAQEGQPGGHPGEPDFAIGLPTPPWLHGLKLTEAQEDKVFTIVYEQLPALREQMKTLHHVHKDLRDLPFADKFDASRAKALTDQIARATAALELAQTNAQSKIWSVLSPEQRKEVTERMQHHEGHDGMQPPPPAGRDAK